MNVLVTYPIPELVGRLLVMAAVEMQRAGVGPVTITVGDDGLLFRVGVGGVLIYRVTVTPGARNTVKGDWQLDALRSIAPSVADRVELLRAEQQG